MKNKDLKAKIGKVLKKHSGGIIIYKSQELINDIFSLISREIKKVKEELLQNFY